MTHSMLLGLIAIMPAVVGPQSGGEPSQTLTAQLCNGGTIEIPLDREPEPDPPCVAKACHAASCRKRFDLAQ